MLYTPSHKLNIISEENYPSAICEISEELEKYRNEGFFTTSDNKQLYYEYYLANESRGSVVVVHGLSEFTKKFYEATYYFLNMGYNVFLYDQRGHGLSHRETSRPELIYFDTFYRLAADLDEFIEGIVKPASDKPLYIYSHSMGCSVAALYLSKNSHKIKKTIMTAPLIEPYVKQTAPWIAYNYAKMMTLFVNKRNKFTFTDEFNPNAQCKTDTAVSPNRFEYHMIQRRKNRNYQSTPMTFGCICELLSLRSKLLKKKVTKGITVPLLIMSSEKDTVVINKAQHLFAERCPNSEIITIKNATHAILAGNTEVLTEHLERTFDFYSC